MEEKKKISWTKIKCVKCGTEKNTRQDRYDKIKAEGRVEKYLCRECKKKEKEAQ